MQVLRVVCILAALPALFCFRLSNEVERFDEGDDQGVVEFEPSTAVVDVEKPSKRCECDHKERNCTCEIISIYHQIPISVEFTIGHGECRCCHAEVNAVFQYGNIKFARTFDVTDADEPRQVCLKLRPGMVYCFEVFMEEDNGVSGCLEVTRPRPREFIGCFHLKPKEISQ